MDPRDQALHRIRIILENSDMWARNFLRTPTPRPVDLDRMACSIVDALEVVRGSAINKRKIRERWDKVGSPRPFVPLV